MTRKIMAVPVKSDKAQSFLMVASLFERFILHPGGPGFCRYDRLHKRLRSEEHTSELQSRFDLVCRLLLEKKKKSIKNFPVNKKTKQGESIEFDCTIFTCLFVFTLP